MVFSWCSGKPKKCVEPVYLQNLCNPPLRTCDLNKPRSDASELILVLLIFAPLFLDNFKICLLFSYVFTQGDSLFIWSRSSRYLPSHVGPSPTNAFWLKQASVPLIVCSLLWDAPTGTHNHSSFGVLQEEGTAQPPSHPLPCTLAALYYNNK